jgi:MEMO1 family protein
MDLRNPVVAGRFYPADKTALQAELESYLVKKTKIKNAFAIIAPHAGYVYSGKTAGATYASVDVPELVIVMCPNHTGLGCPISLHPSQSWVTPLGSIDVDTEILKKIKAKLSQAEFDTGAQLKEHSLEVQIPFIQTCNPKAKIVPITLANMPFGIIQKLGAVLSEIIIEEESRTGKRPLIVASSDMTHFESASKAKRKDLLAIEQIKKFDTKGFIDVIEKQDISLCGIFPISVTIEACKNYAKATGKPIYADLIDYTNSGMVTGDENEVVAYAGLVLHS